MSEQQKGLYGKYVVQKADGSPIDPDAIYFVLRLDTDPAARFAMIAYADFVKRANPTLATQIHEQLRKFGPLTLTFGEPKGEP